MLFQDKLLSWNTVFDFGLSMLSLNEKKFHMIYSKDLKVSQHGQTNEVPVVQSQTLLSSVVCCIEFYLIFFSSVKYCHVCHCPLYQNFIDLWFSEFIKDYCKKQRGGHLGCNIPNFIVLWRPEPSILDCSRRTQWICTWFAHRTSDAAKHCMQQSQNKPQKLSTEKRLTEKMDKCCQPKNLSNDDSLNAFFIALQTIVPAPFSLQLWSVTQSSSQPSHHICKYKINN